MKSLSTITLALLLAAPLTAGTNYIGNWMSTNSVAPTLGTGNTIIVESNAVALATALSTLAAFVMAQPAASDLDMNGSNIVGVGSIQITGEGASAFDSGVFTNGVQLLNVTGSRFLVSDADGRATNDVAATGTGAPVRATSPVLTTPNIGAAIGASLQVDDLAYDATSWDGSTNVPTRNAIRDKIESLTSSGTYILDLSQGSTSGINDSTAYYFGSPAAEGISTTWGNVYAVVPRTGTIKWIAFRGRSGGGSSENGTNYIRLNDTTDTQIGTVNWGTTRFMNIYSNLNVSVTQGDQIAIKYVSPVHATDPSGCTANIQVRVDY